MVRTTAKTLKQVEDAVVVEEKRAAPKEFVIERQPEGLYYIRFTAGGEVPDALKGLWTSILKAENAVANYQLAKQLSQPEAIVA